MLPPMWVRRVVIAPLVVVGLTALVVVVPVWLLVAALASTVLPGRWRPLRFLWFFLVYAALEVVLLIALFGLWIASFFGRDMDRPQFQAFHYRLAHWFLSVITWEAERVLHVRLRHEGVDRTETDGHPLVVCARHAGPGDSFLVVHALLDRYGREPRIVLKDTLQWDPAVDTLLNRLPSRFVPSRRGPGSGDAVIARIGELAERLDDDDALLIFPEGGNFTTGRRQRAIDWLRERGHDKHAARAERMRHLMAPRPRGTTAALVAAPDADVLFVAHVGLEHLSTVRDLWVGLPMDTEVVIRTWRVPAADVPRHPEAVVEWLYGWWAVIDGWLAEQHALREAADPTPATPSG